jgi:membrane protein DedA with SNARE-associated domain
VLLASTIGAVAASLVLYYLGAWIGESNLRQLVKRFERFKLLFVADLERASEIFGRHGGKAILTGHLFPGVGAMISIPAGIKRMPVFGRFMIYTILGCLIWNGGFIFLGLLLGSNWPVVKEYSSIIEYSVLAILIVGIFVLIWRRWRTYKQA